SRLAAQLAAVVGRLDPVAGAEPEHLVTADGRHRQRVRVAVEPRDDDRSVLTRERERRLPERAAVADLDPVELVLAAPVPRSARDRAEVVRGRLWVRPGAQR